MTRDDWRRLAVTLVVIPLVLLAVAMFWAAKTYLSLPMEAGGLFLGPFVGLPLACFGLMLLFGAIQVAVRWWP